MTSVLLGVTCFPGVTRESGIELCSPKPGLCRTVSSRPRQARIGPNGVLRETATFILLLACGISARRRSAAGRAAFCAAARGREPGALDTVRRWLPARRIACTARPASCASDIFSGAKYSDT